MTVTRQRHLFHLAHFCASPPPVTDAMRVADFGQLVADIRGHLEAAAKAQAVT